MRNLLQSASALLLLNLLAPPTPALAQITQMGPTLPSGPDKANQEKAKPDKQKRQREDVEWIWQYTPAGNDKEGRENELVQDVRFVPMLERNFTAPQSFWGPPIGGKYRALAATAYDFLSVPDKVLADDQRYISISGCVVHFCPSRGLLWVDLNSKQQPLMIFSAIQWIQDSKTTREPGAEYTLWIFPNQSIAMPAGSSQLFPAPFARSIARWTRQPLAGSGIVQNITHAILVDPDGAPHEVPIAALGIVTPIALADQKAKP